MPRFLALISDLSIVVQLISGAARLSFTQEAFGKKDGRIVAGQTIIKGEGMLIANGHHSLNLKSIQL